MQTEPVLRLGKKFFSQLLNDRANVKNKHLRAAGYCKLRQSLPKTDNTQITEYECKYHKISKLDLSRMT